MPLTRIQSLGITDGTIVNANINASAAIANTKLSAGAVLQVVNATDSTNRSTTSTSYVTGSNTLSVSITPSSASNKIFIITNFIAYLDNPAEAWFTIFRGATNLAGVNGMATLYTEPASAQITSPISMSYLDSPNTTSATTYQVYVKVSAGGTVFFSAYPSGTVSITAFEIKG
jgi:hypothetical protein